MMIKLGEVLLVDYAPGPDPNNFFSTNADTQSVITHLVMPPLPRPGIKRWCCLTSVWQHHRLTSVWRLTSV